MDQSNTDCYFYYYSTCSKGNGCPFRHEPAALNQETMCSFWLKGKCMKPRCMFRHMELDASKKRTKEKCYWETQPSGCLKPHCPFFHENIKEPYEPEKILATTSPTNAIIPAIPSQLGGGKIIVNRNKLDEIMQTTSNRMVIPPALIPKKSLKDRLGQRVVKEEIEIHEYSDPEEENLRQGAISTLDLRSRIGGKRKFSEDDEEDSFSEPETKKVMSVVKKVKKEKKEKKKKKDKERDRHSDSRKKTKKSKPSGSIAAKTLREITPKIVRKRKSPSKSSDDQEVGGDTLAARIAAQREKSGPGKSSVNKKIRKRSKSVEKRKSKIEPERSVEIVKPKESEYVSLSETRKLKVANKSRKSSVSGKDTVEGVIADVDALLKSSDPALPTHNDSVDVMKELDEFINS